MVTLTTNTDLIYQFIKRDFPRNEVINYNAYVNRTKKGTLESYLLDDKGYCVLSRCNNATLIMYIAIHPHFRNEGFGGIYLHQLSKNLTFVEVDTPTNEINKRRIEFYLRNGFKVINKNYVLFGKDMWVMSNDENSDLSELMKIYERMLGSRYKKCIKY